MSTNTNKLWCYPTPKPFASICPCLSICRVCIAFISTQTNANTHDDGGGGGGREMQKRRALIPGKKDVRSAHKRGREKKVAQSHKRETRWWRIETITTKWPMLKTKIEKEEGDERKMWIRMDGWMDMFCWSRPAAKCTRELRRRRRYCWHSAPPCTHRRRACLCRESICVCTSVAVAKGYLFGRHWSRKIISTRDYSSWCRQRQFF
jgi:hypothetical protein